MPPTGITGATFVDGRMLVAGQDGKTFRVYSIDLATGARELEIERTIVGESEGLVTAAAKGGTLSWLIQPFNPEGNPPTYSPDHATLVSFARRRRRRRRRARRRPARAPGSRPTLRFFHRKRRTVLRRGFLAGVLCPEGCRATLTVKRGHHLLARTSKRVRPGPIAKVRVKLTKRGRRVLREDHRRLRLTLRAALRLPSGAIREAQSDRPPPLVRLDARELAAIFAGGFLGAIARAELVEALPHDPGEWPWATFVVNVAGAFLLGYFVTRLQERLPLSAYRRPFLGTGSAAR